MATVIQNPSTDTSAWSAAIIILAVVVLGILAFFIFDRGALSGGTVQVNVPVSGGTGGAGTGGTSGGSGSGY
jgi:hypothetical protein